MDISEREHMQKEAKMFLTYFLVGVIGLCIIVAVISAISSVVSTVAGIAKQEDEE